MAGRVIQCFIYLRNGSAHDNHYAHPLDLLVFLDMNSGRILETQVQPSPPVIPQMNFNYLAPLVHQERGTRTGMPRSCAVAIFCRHVSQRSLLLFWSTCILCS